MTATRNTVIAALADYLTDELQAAYGRGSCTRDLAADPDKIAPERTPALLVWERWSELLGDVADNDWPVRQVGISIVGLIKLWGSGSSAGTIQTQLNELEAVLDGLLSVNRLAGIDVDIEPDGRCEYGPTSDKADQGVIEYPIKVTFRRE